MNGLEIAKPFIKATVTVLSTMAGITPVPGKPYAKTTAAARGDVSAVVGITGDMCGSISVTFTKACAIAMVKGMLGDDIVNIVQDVQDAVGEVANMISGQTRAGLAEQGMSLQGSTPSVIMGDDHVISHFTKGIVMAVPFATEHGDFTVEFCFE